MGASLHTLKGPSRYTMCRLTGVANIHICMQLSFHEIFLTFFEEYWIAISFIFVLQSMMVKIFQKNSEDTDA